MRNSKTSFESVQPVLASIERRPGEVLYVRPNERTFTHNAFLVIWLGGWTYTGHNWLWDIFSPEEEKGPAILAFSIAIWILGWFSAAFFLIWSLIGKQTIVANADRLIHIAQVGPFKRTRYFQPESIKALRWVDTHSIVTGGERTTQSASIKFDYGAKTISIFQGISHPEGNQLIDELGAALAIPRSPT